MARGTTQFEVTFTSSGLVEVAALPRSRRKAIAIACGVILALGPALFASVSFQEARPDNHGNPVAAAELITVVPGSATAERDGEVVPAAVVEPDGGVAIVFGELGAGSSAGYDDLIRLRNDGPGALLVHVDVAGISEAPMHVSVSGDDAPGAFFIEPGAERSVDLATAVDITAVPGDVTGDVVVRSASGYLSRTIPSRITVTAPSTDDLLSALLGGTNTNARDGVLGDLSEGLEAPGFSVDGVWDGGAYAADVSVAWEPVGPLTDVSATLDGRQVPSSFVVRDGGDHVLHLEGKVLGSAVYSEDIGFRIDKTAPESVLVSPPMTPARNATFLVNVSDEGPVAGVDVVLLRQEEPEPSPTPTPTPTASAAPGASPEPTASPEPIASPAPDATPTPSPDPSASRAGGASSADPIRMKATYDEDSGLWRASGSIPEGDYLAWVEAVDAVGNASSSDPRPLRAVTVVPANVSAALQTL